MTQVFLFNKLTLVKLDSFVIEAQLDHFVSLKSHLPYLAHGGYHVVMSIHDGESSFFFIDNSTEVSFTTSYSSPSTGSSTTNWHWLTRTIDGNINNPRFRYHKTAA